MELSRAGIHITAAQGADLLSLHAVTTCQEALDFTFGEVTAPSVDAAGSAVCLGPAGFWPPRASLPGKGRWESPAACAIFLGMLRAAHPICGL